MRYNKSGEKFPRICYICRSNFNFYHMNYEISGKLIFKEETQHISDKFQKREFVIEVENEKNSQWNDFVKVQLIQDRCDLLENIALNEYIKVYFNIRGRKWENKGQTSYFTNLEGWRIFPLCPKQTTFPFDLFCNRTLTDKRNQNQSEQTFPIAEPLICQKICLPPIIYPTD